MAVAAPWYLGMETMAPPLGEHHDAYNSMLGMNGALMMPHLNGVNAAASSAAAAAAAAAAAVKQQQQQAAAAVQQVNGSAASTAAANSAAQTVASNAAAATQPQPQTQQPQQSSSGRSTPNSSDPAAAKLFVGGLSWQTSSEKLRQYFGMFGSVTDVLIMKDPITQRSRGFGFITFSDPETVEKVLKVPIHTLDGKKIDPKHATPKNRPKLTNRTKKIFVGGVSQDTSSEEVKAYFGQFGKVEETVMLMDQQTKRHRGFGFVTFESEDVVDRICEIHFHTIKNKKVECKKAQPKEAVQSGLLLSKRVMMGVGPLRMAAPASVAPVVAAQAQAQAQVQAVVAAQNAAQSAAYGKLLSGCGYPGLGYRYAPYPVTAPPTPAPPAPPAAPTLQTLAPLTTTATNPYQGYNLTNVDMSSFQGVDWSSMYGMGMYV
ncbi:RNA-binding protein Musashi homolog Rbp6 isoform X2 [Nilaparvata lugens]|uniref:RNA-binding protein Musashi homolog Rbp6 isoform X2 n=1 Tax=Nilaparvata lugens TaxID=108931 RepID=UPI00193D3BA1|nr:RNA-binding protein Musashi homolog Rbp6 isoform X2 [Nilaparvata lugens]XP_039281996.1 RNA-binding protein Musashi homolog Rbp6 isoform X2 [Nilaparvata lugens]XP_039281997.1 RNA-binding protein Musashi homolog Rbp6 isoform X2 [Nilaparvata lugens]XP_039281998.1 RNA-binding protein Musashi homolog Rbp6 isoform X2 [Nilaparvata lugens]XP_039281999.1 RNA-binding protein Musashi homolog Rbp6 isoform X2 [Nilaparvata lugens]XP_039282000.1 RNA-binding protein Musashi homolog Rbp6 isoform X2 [Nilapar